MEAFKNQGQQPNKPGGNSPGQGPTPNPSPNPVEKRWDTAGQNNARVLDAEH